MTKQPFAVIVGSDASDTTIPDGWRAVNLDDLPGEPFDLTNRRLVVTASVADGAAAWATLVAAARGCAVVVDITMDDDAAASFVDDLGRIVDIAGRRDAEHLDDDHRMLLERLAAGSTLVEAAQKLGWSRRTAARRLAEGKRRLRTSSTATAIRAFRDVH